MTQRDETSFEEHAFGDDRPVPEFTQLSPSAVQTRNHNEAMLFSAKAPTSDSHEFRMGSIDQDFGNSKGDITDAEFLGTLPDSVNRTLLENFWTHYNCELQSIYRPTFELGMRTNNSKTYSPFLHLCMLGIGLRYSELTKQDRTTFFSPLSKEPIFHVRATQAIKSLIEGACEVSLIQGLLLFEDLEFGIGRYNNGWMHANLAYQLCVQSNLHLQPSNSLPPEEVQNRAMSVLDFILGRKSALRIENIGIRKPTDLQSGTENLRSVFMQKETQVYAALMELMDLLAGFNAREELHSSAQDEHSYLMVAILRQQLLKWYSKLSNSLKWVPENINDAPACFFSLHQQFHYGMILLHRAFAFSDHTQTSDPEAQEEMERLYSIPRRLILDSAMQIAGILLCQQQKFHIRTIFATSLQHAEAAASVIAKTLERNHAPDDLSNLRRAYSVVLKFVRANTVTYAAAARLLQRLAVGESESPSSSLASAPPVSLSPIWSPQPQVQPEYTSSNNMAARAEPLPSLSAQNATGSSGGQSSPEPNFPNIGNIIYAHEMASLGIEGPL